MISYIKTQWGKLVVGFLSICLSIGGALRGDILNAAYWMTTGTIWLVMSRVDHNEDRIELLEKKAEKYEALAEKVQTELALTQLERDLFLQKISRLEEELCRGN